MNINIRRYNCEGFIEYGSKAQWADKLVWYIQISQYISEIVEYVEHKISRWFNGMNDNSHNHNIIA